MKKIVIPVVALLLAGVLFISLPLYKRYRVGGFVREFNNIHMLSWSQLDPGYVRADTEQGSFALTSGNLHYISSALTREANMVYHFFRPKTADLPQITLTFPSQTAERTKTAATSRTSSVLIRARPARSPLPASASTGASPTAPPPRGLERWAKTDRSSKKSRCADGTAVSLSIMRTF